MTADLEIWQRSNWNRIWHIISMIQFNDWKFELKMPPGISYDTFHSPYFQVVVEDGKDNVTGKPLSWKGRKWQVSYYSTDTEVVRAVHKAVHAAMEHEIDEQFKYRGETPFNPHTHIDELVMIARTAPLDERPKGPSFE